MTEPRRHSKVRWSAWNLLLLLPLLWLFTPMFNRSEPRLIGVPFFYWFQLMGVLLGAAVTALVYLATRDTDRIVFDDDLGLLDVDPFAEGSLR